MLIYTAIGFALTLLFRADVDAQGGAYATGVLVLMTSAAMAVTLSVVSGCSSTKGVCFALATLVFLYTTLVNVIERPDGLKIGAFLIAAIVLFRAFGARRNCALKRSPSIVRPSVSSMMKLSTEFFDTLMEHAVPLDQILARFLLDKSPTKCLSR